MTLVPMQKKCSVCGKLYEWNLDVGVGLSCPHCKNKGFIGKLREILLGENRM